MSFFVDNLSQGLSTDDTGDIVTVNVAMYIGHAGPRKRSRPLCAFLRSLKQRLHSENQRVVHRPH